MAVSENDLVVGPLTPAAGVTTISLDFYFEKASWLEVYKAGLETPLVLNTHYTVAGAGSDSGVVTLTTAANGTDAYSIYLAVPLERSSDMQLRGEFKSGPFNVEMDRIWQRLQHHNTLLGRTLRVGRTDDAPGPYTPDPETVLGFDAVGATTLYPVNAAVTINLDPDDVVRRDNAAAVIADTAMGYTSGASVQVSAGQYVLTTAEGFAYEVAASGATDHHLTTAGGVKLYVLPGADGGVNVAALGADGIGDETSLFEDAALIAEAAGGVVVIPFSTFSVSTAGADAKGCAIIGSDTTVAGHFQNVGRMTGIKIGGIRQDRKQTHPPIVFDETLKLIHRNTANQYRLLMQTARGGYALATLVNNITTANDSLAATTSDQTQWRVNGLLRCVEVLTGYLTASGSSGTWAAVTLSTGVTAFTSGDFYEYTRSSDIGAWKEFTVDVPEDGFLSVSLLTGTTASGNVDVSVDGTVVEAGIDTTNSANYRMTRTYRAKPGTRVVRVENKTVGSSGLNIIGINFAPLKDQRGDVSIDTYGYYRNSAFTDPLVSNSANDYAIWDLDAGVWGGSYHGGETGLTEAWYVDGENVSLTTGTFAIGSSIEILQTSIIDWSSLGGGAVEVTTRHIPHIGGYTLACNFTGEVRARDYFTTLWGVAESYTSITAPENLSISSIADGARHPLPYGGTVEYMSSGGDRLRIEHSTYDWSQIKEGGPFVWRVVGTYHKYYNAIVTSGNLNVNKIHAVNRITIT